MAETVNDMTKEQFYKFANLMYKDSKILFDNESYHNSVYLGAFVLEGYIKYLILKNNPDDNFFGHINKTNFTQKINILLSTGLSNNELSILRNDSDIYPHNIFSYRYNIGFRYEIDSEKWDNREFAEKIQNEIEPIKILLLGLDGVTYDNN